MSNYKYPQLHDVEWLKSQLEENPMRAIASRVGCTYGAVVYAVRKYQLEVPHRRTYAVTVNKSKIGKEAYRKKYPNGRFGDKASNWKGGRRVANGYVFLYAPDHPLATQNKPYIQEHRLVVESELGRYLRDDEVVHHIDGNRQNNSIENLEVKERGEHVSDHFKASHEVTDLRKQMIYLEDENAQLRQRVAELEERIKELEE
jgi:hypothetical protein